MFRVLLFNLPPSGGNLFPISLGYITATLINQGIDTLLEDLTIDKPKSPKQIVNLIERFHPQIVGLSVCQYNMREVLAIAELAKKINPKIVTIIGGPQVTFMPKEALPEMSSIDVICKGEGEVVLPALCECIKYKRGMEMVKGIAFKKNNIVIETKQEKLKKNLDNFPSPYQIGVFNFSEHGIGAMLTSRGCYSNCSFCYTPRAFQRIIRHHSPRSILEDINICIQNNIREFFFCDPNFTFDKTRVIEIMDGIIKKRWEISIWCETRTDLVDIDMLAKMAKGGVKKIAYGLESADKKILRTINKKIDLEQFKKIVKMTQDLGIEVEVFTLYGLPKQTYESARQTLEFVKDLKVKIRGNSGGQQLSLYFGTDIYDNPEKFGIHIINKRRPLFLSPATTFETEYMDKQDISAIRMRHKQESFLDAIEADKVSQNKLEDCIVNYYPTEHPLPGLLKIVF